ncbi:unnamed protein product, partial [Heterosigma akashiwo]
VGVGPGHDAAVPVRGPAVLPARLPPERRHPHALPAVVPGHSGQRLPRPLRLRPSPHADPRPVAG